MKRTRIPNPELMIQQGATALLAATFKFLRRNDISHDAIVSSMRQPIRSKDKDSVAFYRLMRAYEAMGIVISTWYSQPKFLDKSGCPLPLTVTAGARSVANLIRASRVRIPKYMVIELMRQSPSVKWNSDGTFSAVRRVFVLPEFEVPRAALVVERYLDTLQRNASGRRRETTLLLERSCHAPGVNLKTIAPILRDIKERGTAFMDSVDGEIEACRVPRARQRAVGELGVLVFAWTSPSRKARVRKDPLRRIKIA
jgi:hypothetical protein